ncbi:MAG: hypothetical protein Fur0010_12930 [Bdellovibrio sp.]
MLGWAAILAKWALAEASPEIIGFYRMLFALPLLFILNKGRIPKLNQSFAFAFFAGIFFAGDLTFWHTGVGLTSASNATFMVGLSPLWVSLWSWYHDGRPPKIFLLGLSLALSGAFVLAFFRGFRLSLGKGELISLVASFFYAACTIALSRGRRMLEALEALIAMSTGACFTFLLVGLLRSNSFSGFSPKIWCHFALLSIFVQIGGWASISWALKNFEARVASMALMLQQVATLFLGMVVLNEVPRTSDWAGSFLILLGLFMGLFLSKK